MKQLKIYLIKYIKDETLRLYDRGDDKQKNFSLEITRKSFYMNSDHYKCTKYIKQQLFENKYGGGWSVFLKTRNYSNSSFTYSIWVNLLSVFSNLMLEMKHYVYIGKEKYDKVNICNRYF